MYLLAMGPSAAMPPDRFAAPTTPPISQENRITYRIFSSPSGRSVSRKRRNPINASRSIIHLAIQQPADIAINISCVSTASARSAKTGTNGIHFG